MPHANIWIRKENEESWNAIADKSAWLNAVLKNASDTSNWGESIDTPVGPATVILTEKLCEHKNVNKRTRICTDCGEPQ